jgi:hypothetical protein
LAFTSDGQHLLCVVNGAQENAYVQIFRITGTEALHPVCVDYHTRLRISGLLAVQGINGLLVTLTRNEQCFFDNGEIPYEVKLWTLDMPVHGQWLCALFVCLLDLYCI